MYSEIVMDHFVNPRNVGIVVNANGRGIAGDPECGDYLEITINVKSDNTDVVKDKPYYISDIKFKVHGCAGAISTSSMVTELAKGLHIIEAYKLENKDVIKALGGLPEEKIHCSLLGIVALRKAIINFAELEQQEEIQAKQNIIRG